MQANEQHSAADISSLRDALSVELNDAQLHLVAALHNLTRHPVDDIALMVEAISRGETISEFVGMTPEVLNAMEQTGVTLYRNKRYAEARNIFVGARFFGEMHGFARPHAIRGIAACDHSEGFYLDAIELYEEALAVEPGDTISRMALAECLCHIGEGQRGVAAARQVLAAIERDATQAPLIARARALIAAGGGTKLPHAHRRRAKVGPTVAPQSMAPDPEAFAEQISKQMERDMPDAALDSAHSDEDGAPMPEALDLEEAIDAFAEALVSAASPERGVRPPEWVPPAGTEAFFAEPGSFAMVDELAELVRQKRITIREIAAFTPDQMEAAYAVACSHLSRGEIAKATQLCGWLIYIDSREPRYYRLSGLCMQHAKLYNVADHYYDLARIWSSAPDAATDIYQGEVALMIGEPERAATLLAQGVAQVRNDPAFAALVSRGTALLKQLAAGQFEHETSNTSQPTRAQ